MHNPIRVAVIDPCPLYRLGVVQAIARSSQLLVVADGGTAALATMADDKPGDMRKHGFRAAIVLYPFCSLKKRYDKKPYEPYAPVRVFMGADDKGSSPEACQGLADRSRKKKGDIELTLYAGAAHGFDEPGRTNQAKPASAAATEDLRGKAASFFDRALAPR